MAEYENLTTLQDLVPGDTVSYKGAGSGSANPINYTINFAKKRVRITIYGRRNGNGSSGYGNGGKVSAVIDFSKLPDNITYQNMVFTQLWGASLCAGSVDIYRRILVAGDSGAGSSSKSGSDGGGLIGGSKSPSYVGGGTQTAGGMSYGTFNVGTFGIGFGNKESGLISRNDILCWW